MSGFGGFKMGLKGRQIAAKNVFSSAPKLGKKPLSETIDSPVKQVDSATQASTVPPTDITQLRSVSTSVDKYSEQKLDGDEDSDVDPFDAFMASVDKQAKEDQTTMGQVQPNKVLRAEFEEEDDQEAYFKHMKEKLAQEALMEQPEEEIQYDSDDNPIILQNKEILPLPPIDHSEIEYRDFEKNFYIEHEDIAALNRQAMIDLRKTLGIRVSGYGAAKPVTSFAHFGFDERLMGAIRKMGFTTPTPIQSQAVPVAMSGRDVIGMAKTGSGKTAAFIFPMIVHIMDQPELDVGEGPIALIVAPTRELAQQIYIEAKRYCKPFGLRVVAVNGGESKWEQTKELKEGAEVCVATPGRWIDMVKSKAAKMNCITYLVLDEADRMFAMGFELQVKSIIEYTRPDRQTLMFSATFKRKIEDLARKALTDPVRIVVGETGEANTDITQSVIVLKEASEKWHWLTQRLVQFTSAGSVLVFVGKRENCAQLGESLLAKGFEVGLIHGDLHQEARNQTISDFKKKKINILVATDVAARGLDISHIKTVINFDSARDIDTHTHRIGRTGRAGEKGTAYTLLLNTEDYFATQLVGSLEGANQIVPEDLLAMAMRNPRFGKNRGGIGMRSGKKPFSGPRPVAILGGGQRKRGIGAIAETSSNSTFLGSRSSSAPADPSVHPSRQGVVPTTRNARASSGVSNIAIRQKYASSFTRAADQGTFAAGSIPPENQGNVPSTTGGTEKRKKKSRWG
eukprot:CFRG4084T1